MSDLVLDETEMEAAAAQSAATAEKGGSAGREFLSIPATADNAQVSLKVNAMRTANLLDSIVEGRHPCCSSGKKSLIRSVSSRKAFHGIKQLQLQEGFSFKDSPVNGDAEWSHVVGTKLQFEKLGVPLDVTKNLVPYVGKDGREKSDIWSVPCADIGYAKDDAKKENLLVSPIYRYYAAEQTVDSALAVKKMHENADERRAAAAEKRGEQKENGFDFSQLSQNKVEARDADVTKYLTAYLTACKMGCEFSVSEETAKAFRSNVDAMTKGRESERFSGKTPRRSNTAEFAKCCSLAEAQSTANVAAEVESKKHENAQSKSQRHEQSQSVERS